MVKVLVVVGHNSYKNSFANKYLVEHVKKNKLIKHEVEFDILSENYPDMKIDVKKEQEKLSKADILVLQYPIHWYGWPTIMQKWLEDVWAYGWAYGSKGGALKGKKMLSCMTVGAPQEGYKKPQHPAEELFNHDANSARFVGMSWEGAVFEYGCLFLPQTEEKKKQVIANVEKLAKKLADKVNALK